MKIVFADIKKIIDEFGTDFLDKFVEKEFKSTEKKYEHAIGRLILNRGLKEFYGIHEYNININQNGKPKVDCNIEFSISHSKEYVMVGFSENPIGVDIEKIKPRDFQSILNHYKITKSVSDIEFYQLWTDYESRYKSSLDNSKCFKLNNYIFSISSEDKEIEFYEYDGIVFQDITDNLKDTQLIPMSFEIHA